MKYFILFIVFAVPIVAIFFAYKYIDNKNKEPKRAILFTIIFATFIFFVEFFIVKPSIGKLLSFYDTYLFVYFLTEEKSHLASLSLSQNMLIVILACFSKAITFAVGLKVLYTYLYKLGKKKWFSGKHKSDYGFLDEPIDYCLYSIVFFVSISLWDSIVQFRFDSTYSLDKLTAIFLILAYICIAILVSTIWVEQKVRFKSQPKIISFFGRKEKIAFEKKTFLKGLISSIEIKTIILLFILLLVIKTPVLFNSLMVESLSIAIAIAIICILFYLLKEINLREYDVMQESHPTEKTA